MTPKRIAALLIAGLLFLLYLITLTAAIFAPAQSSRLFGLCLFATVAVPLLAWIYIWMYGKLTGRHTIADPELPQDPQQSDSESSQPPEEEPAETQQPEVGSGTES